MATARFISETYFKETVPIQNNVAAKDITSHIDRAHDIDLQYILGSKLYNELTAADTATATADQLALIAYCKPFLAHMAYYYALPFIWAKTTNMSVNIKSSENSQTVTSKDIEYLRAQIKNQAEFYGVRIKDYLNEPASRTKYPSYYSPDSPISPSKGSAYFSGIYLK